MWIVCFCCYTLNKNDEVKLLESMNRGFKRSIKWNKYISTSIKCNNGHFDYLIDPSIKNVLCL